MKLYLLLLIMNMPSANCFARKQIVKKKSDFRYRFVLGVRGRGWRRRQFLGHLKPGSSLAKVTIVCSCLQQCKGGEKRRSWVSEPILPLPGLQSRICLGQVQWGSSEGRGCARQWGWCCQSYRNRIFFLGAACIIQSVLLQVIYALLMRLLWMREQPQLI